MESIIINYINIKNSLIWKYYHYNYVMIIQEFNVHFSLKDDARDIPETRDYKPNH